MRSRYKIVSDEHHYFITSTIVEWLPIFTKKEYCNIIIDSLDFCQKNKGLYIHAYVILDNHIHLVVSGKNLVQILKDFKSFSAKQIIKELKKDDIEWLLNQLAFFKKKHKIASQYQVWQEGFHPQLINGYTMLKQKIEYIHNNPVKRGLVEDPVHWLYSSARNYFGGSGELDIEMIE
ncbi:transposase [Candidatus Peregrinibacteria bacterium]|nr:transposase [Candidatus Peregrinibacteria bacterium]